MKGRSRNSQAWKIKDEKMRYKEPLCLCTATTQTKGSRGQTSTTYLNVFTRHVFHHSWEEVWCVFTTGDHLERKQEFERIKPFLRNKTKCSTHKNCWVISVNISTRFMPLAHWEFFKSHLTFWIWIHVIDSSRATFVIAEKTQLVEN